MNDRNEQYFSPDFILDYIHGNPAFGIKRLLTYTIFRFFSFAGKETNTLAPDLKKQLFADQDVLDFDMIETYLTEDYYFSPSFEENSFDPFYLCAAIYIAEGSLAEYAIGNELDVVDNLILSMYPVLSSAALDDETLVLDSLIGSGAEFYAALYLALTRYPSQAGMLLPKLSHVYHRDYHFTSEDFVLYDFMDEYFEQKNCRNNASFTEMIDTLVDATLGYYKTDIETLLSTEVSAALHAVASKFSALKCFGSISIDYLPGHETSRFMLQEMLRYAAAYELRNNLFDYHLEEDNLITLANWKEKLRWHYVQYSNVLEPAIDAFYAGVLSRKLVKAQFKENLNRLQ